MFICVRDAALRHAEWDKPGNGTAQLRERQLSWADLVEGDLLVIPVLDVEEHHHPAVLVSAGQDTRVAGFDGAAHGLGGQVVEELGVLLAEVDVAWRKAETREDNGCLPGLGKPGQRWGSCHRRGGLLMARRWS